VIGLFTVPAAVLLTIILATQPEFRRTAWGVLIGIGVPFLLVAYLNREGPGTVCHSIDGGRGTQCDDLSDPRNWLLVGLALVLAGLAAQLWAASTRASRA